MSLCTIDDLEIACFGCSACQTVCPKKAIRFIEDEKGFKRPEIGEKCVACGMCIRVCPATTPTVTGIGKQYYAMKNTDEKIRNDSASGGIFSILANYIFEMDGSVYGVVYDKSFHAVHKRITTENELSELRGSKYVQSDVGQNFEHIRNDLLNGRYVLFSGTSCQCDGLTHYLREKNVNTKNLLTVAILCHGVPSPKIFLEHLHHIEKVRGKKISGYYNREKIHGWHEHNECIHFLDGTIEWRSKLSQNFKDLFYKNVILREACYSCPYAATLAASDIVIGDFWGIEYSHPQLDDKKGTSIVISNTDKAEKVIEAIFTKVDSFKVNETDALKYNHHSPCKKPEIYELFWRDYFRHGYEFVTQKYASDSFWGRLKWRTKKELRRLLVALRIFRA